MFTPLTILVNEDLLNGVGILFVRISRGYRPPMISRKYIKQLERVNRRMRV